MSKNFLRVTALAGASLIAAAALTGCTINIGTPTNNGNGMMGSNSSKIGMMGATASSAAGLLSSADKMFAEMMIPHHQQAVDMGTLAETRASDPKVKALAAQIKSEQAPEIATMKSWLGEDESANTDSESAMPMGGMLTAAQMAELEAATGEKFDKLYLTYMIQHHEGAISMAQMVVNSKNVDVKKLAESIIASQTKQIAYMKQLLGQ